METLRKIIVVHGPANAGKTAVVNLLAIRLINEEAYQKIKKSKAAAHDFLSEEQDSMVLYSDYGVNKKLRKIALCSKGDSIDDIIDAFEFAEDCRANVLVIACRNKSSKGKGHGSKQFIFLRRKVGAHVLSHHFDMNNTVKALKTQGVAKKNLSKDVIKAVDGIYNDLYTYEKQ